MSYLQTDIFWFTLPRCDETLGKGQQISPLVAAFLLLRLVSAVFQLYSPPRGQKSRRLDLSVAEELDFDAAAVGRDDEVLLQISADELEEGPVRLVHLDPVPQALAVVLQLRTQYIFIVATVAKFYEHIMGIPINMIF